VSDFWRVLRLAAPYKLLVLAVLVCITIATVVDAGVFPIFASLILGLLFAGHTPPAAIKGIPGIGDLPLSLRNLWIFQGIRSSSGAEALHWLWLLSAGLLLAYAVRFTSLAGSTYSSQYIAQHVMYSLRRQLYERVLRLSLGFHDRHAAGDLMSRMVNDVLLIQNMLSIQLADAAATLITLVVGLGLMLVISWQLTLLALVLVPLMGLTISRAGQRIRKTQTTVQQRLSNISARLQERLYSIRIIQSFARERYEEDRFADLNARNVEANMRSVRIIALLGPLVELIGVVGMVAGIVFAGWQVMRGLLLPQLLAAYLFAVQRVGERFAKIGGIVLSVQQALAAARRIFEILDQEPTVADAPDARPLPRARGHVRFRDVAFAYTAPPGRDQRKLAARSLPAGAGGLERTPEPVLHDLNLEVQPGEVVALVGPSGAGKTTLVSLLPRFYDPTSGQVEIDGADLRRVTLQSLRDQVAIVPQETTLFSGSVYDNIRYGKLDATPDEIYAAARAANADQFIDAMPQGYDSDVGERGLRLSGGQRQRIAIARALLKDPAILILDEATSSLDMESEALVQEALERLMKGRTTFVIAHRLPTVRNADRILVLGDGHIIEQGSHDELMARGGMYRRLYEMQFRDAPARPEPAEGRDQSRVR
jgi:subfamily B ATP-binding cassette protein MsbA